MAMVSGLFHSVSNLCGRRENWRLRVKLVRKWNMCVVASPNDPYALQMVFVDEQVVSVLVVFHLLGQIEATVQKQNLLKFTHAMVEGQVYRISNFIVVKNRGKFRGAHHDFKLLFTCTTKATPCVGTPISDLGFSLMKTSDIKKTNGNWNYLLDFMGVIIAISEEINVNTQGRQTRLMLLDFVDEMGEIRFAVFGELINEVVELLSQTTSGLPVVIVQFAKVNLYRGQVGIQNVMNATKLLWNPDLPIAVEFKNGCKINNLFMFIIFKLVVLEIETDIVISMIPDRSRPVSMREDFLRLYPRKSVGELNETVEVVSITNPAGCSIVMATIAEILEDCQWWYMACSCMKSVTYEPGYSYCVDCKCTIFELTPRYKMKLVVTNGDYSAPLILFDSECYSLLQRSCRDMLSLTNPQQGRRFPHEICSLVGKELLFKVETKEGALMNFEDSFKVKRICCDPSILCEFKEGLNIETPQQDKFQPLFTKVGPSDDTSCALDFSPQPICVVSEMEVSSLSVVGSSSSLEGVSLGKRSAEESVEAPLERKT
ncbi:hypothetical protein SESBI_07920 [Sesbania bispinosa]|nr:hypothetical protein SESBI_07920 [Sesbania bispinosa]